MNSAHVHSILRIFSPVLAGEHAGKARKSSLDLTFRLPKIPGFSGRKTAHATGKRLAGDLHFRSTVGSETIETA